MSTLKDRLRLPSPALVVAVIALVLGMAGAAYAVKKIGPEGLKKNAVKTKKIVDKAVTTQKLEDEAVTTVKLDPPERSEGFVANSSDTTPLPTGTSTAIATLTLPANGKYVVNAYTALGSPTDAIVDCNLRDDGTDIAVAGASVNASAAVSGNIALTGVSDGGKVDLACETITGTANAHQRAITATRVANVTGP